MKSIWDRWKKIAKIIGNFQAKVIFSILYFVLITPLGFFVGLSKDYLNKNNKTWNKVDDVFSDLEKVKKQ